MKEYEGKRIRLLRMFDDYPVAPGTTGTVRSARETYYKVDDDVVEGWHLNIDWDTNRSLAVLCPPDKIEIIEETSDVEETVSEEKVQG